MIREVVILYIKAGQEAAFEKAFASAQSISIFMPGYVSHQLQGCIENGSPYILLVNWQTLEDLTIGFRQSPAYQTWRELLHHFYDPFPVVEQYRPIFSHV